MYFLVIGGYIVLDFQMTLKRKNNHSTEFSVGPIHISRKCDITQDSISILSKVKHSKWPLLQPSWF